MDFGKDNEYGFVRLLRNSSEGNDFSKRDDFNDANGDPRS